MPEKSNPPIIRPQGQFLRAANLERDFDHPEALKSFVLTDLLREHICQIAEGLNPKSGKRAWRLTGDYGSGKSTFALALAHWISGNLKQLPSNLHKALEYKRGQRPNLFPLLVTAKREPIHSAIKRAVLDAFNRNDGLRANKKILGLLNQETLESEQIFELLHLIGELVEKKGFGFGLILIVDELGKLLEYTAINPEEADVYTWQLLAEDAMRSRKRPFVILGLLHQGFSAYAVKLGMEQKREWEKVAGRFSELVLHHPTVQLAQIISGALNVDESQLPITYINSVTTIMEAAVKYGWYGYKEEVSSLRKIAPKLFPLDPFVLPVLSRLFHSVGQNERSLFSFLFGGEAYSVMNRLSNSGTESFRLSDLYDYCHANLHRELSIAKPTTWPIVKTMVDAHANDEMALQIIKTIGLLNLVSSSDLLATQNIVCWACAGKANAEKVTSALQALQSDLGRRAVYDRGAAGGLCLWSYTSVDMHALYRDAKTAIAGQINAESFVRNHLDENSDGYVVARSHYIETGNLRYFPVSYLSPDEALEFSIDQLTGDGVILVPFYHTLKEFNRAASVAAVVAEQSNVILVVPALSLSELQMSIEECAIWESIASVGELNTDPYAREIASKRKHYALTEFYAKLKEAIGLDVPLFNPRIRVYYQGERQKITSPKQLIQLVSRACDETFTKAPIVLNELVNRRSLSPAAAGARTRLIEGVLERRHLPILGMDSTKTPPEMSMYKSILQKGCLHILNNGIWDITIPIRDPLRIVPSILKIDSILLCANDERVPIDMIFDELAKPPYGISTGLAGLLLAIFFAIRESEVAMYEDDYFLSEVKGSEFMRLNKKPSSFYLQRCKIEGVRSLAFARLSNLLQIPENKSEEILDVIRPLSIFAANLPEYVHKTKTLTPKTLSVRNALLTAKDPLKLLFTSLPEACGIFPIKKSSDDSQLSTFVDAIKESLIELRECYLSLLSRIEKAIRENFNDTSSNQEWRETLSERAAILFHAVTDPQLKAFVFRLADTELSVEEWLESVASLVQSKPPESWGDNDESLFHTKLSELTARFFRTEAVLFGSVASSKGRGAATAVRICLTRGTGVERKQVFSMGKRENQKVKLIQKKIENLIEEHGELAILAVSQALWQKLPKQE